MSRPTKYKNADELRKAIDVYFKVQEITDGLCTITDGAASLGFKSRQTFYNYEKKAEFATVMSPFSVIDGHLSKQNDGHR